MKALTIKQPWASLIMFNGKDIENRDWAAPRWMIGQRIAIHSSKSFAELGYDLDDAIELCASRNIPWSINESQYRQCGVILGTAQLIACVEASRSPWFAGKYGFVLKDPRPLVQPIATRGALGFWNVPAPILAQLETVQA